MKSTLSNMILSLTVLTALAGGALAAVNLVTSKPIEEAKARTRLEAMGAILPYFDNDIAATATTLPDDLTLYVAKTGDTTVGAAVETYSDNGFSGRITLLVGFDASGILTGYRVLEQNETPGLGARMGEWFATEPHSVIGTQAVLAVGRDVDAITGATITSRAFLDAVNKAREAYMEAVKSKEGI